MKKEELRDYLLFHCHGRERSKSGRQLERTLRTSKNELCKKVNCLRREGVPIASDRSGYFYAATAGEVYTTIQGLKKMRAGLDAAIAGLEGTLDTFPGLGR